MRAFRRLTADESGMVMGLAIIMIVLIGVMGAGLLVFVQRDLQTVVEVNQGQRALETADAGVEAAKRQLASDSTIDHYNGGTNEIQWSGSSGGVELENFDGSDTTEDTATVTIEYNSADSSFKVISTGDYADARRKVEAIFKTGTGTGLPAYYTPGDIYLKDDVSVKGVSMFSGRNMIIEPNSSVSDFIQDYEKNNFGPLEINDGVDDVFGDWNRPPWNTVGRTKDGSPFTKVGFAAEGLICGNSSCSSSIADGVYGYDSTTGTRGNNLKFAEKTPPDAPNPTGTISYPFPVPTADAEYLKGLAVNQPDGSKYLNLATQSLNWDTLYPNARSDRVVFIDANGSDITFATGNQARNQGILVVRCAGVLTMDQNFDGIIIVLKGTDGVHGSGCSDKARYKSNGADIKGYVYAEGTSTTSPSIDLISNSVISPLPGGKEHLLGLSGLGSSNTKLVAWRELYQ